MKAKVKLRFIVRAARRLSVHFRYIDRPWGEHNNKEGNR